MDAWEKLMANSSLTLGDAWEHLNAQEGGGGGDIYIGSMLSASIETAMSATIQTSTLTASVGNTVSANFASPALSANISTNEISSITINTLETDI